MSTITFELEVSIRGNKQINLTFERKVTFAAIPRAGEFVYFKHPDPKEEEDNTPVIVDRVRHTVEPERDAASVEVVAIETYHTDDPSTADETIRWFESLGFVLRFDSRKSQATP